MAPLPYQPSNIWNLLTQLMPRYIAHRHVYASAFPSSHSHLHHPHIRRRSCLRLLKQKDNIKLACGRRVLVECSSSNGSPALHPRDENRNVLQVAFSVGLSTALSKALGLFRETILAAVFGVGPVMTAFSYSSMLPGFFMAILGGINGPLQVTTMAFVSKLERKEGRIFVGKMATVVALVCGALSAGMFLCSGAIIDAMAPGLRMDSCSNDLTRKLAILQMKIMSPCAFLAGLVGVGFGTLSAAGVYEVLSLSPIISSMFVILAVVLHLVLNSQGVASENPIKGSIFLAFGVMLGAVGQWIWQTKAQYDCGLDFVPFQAVDLFNDTVLQEVLRVLLPAIVASGMLQLATLTDLYFASFIPGAAAGLGYANLLVLAPLGILSSSILLPMSSLFARLTKPSDWDELKIRVGEGLLALLAATLPMTAVMISLARPIVEVALQRFAFDTSASQLVSSMMAFYVAGSSAFLARDLLTHLFYALGDGHIPFLISVIAIFSNALLDWKLMQVGALGPAGLVLSTALVNVISVVALLMLLSRRLHDLPIKRWLLSSLKMLGSSIVSGFITQLVYKGSMAVLSDLRLLQMAKACSLILASFVGVATFILILYVGAENELNSVIMLLKCQLSRQTKVTE